MKQYAAEKGVLHQFEFTGFVEEYQLYRLMQGSLALLAPLPQDLQTVARFSTKLGYYLASGAPVVTNAVGDVGLYLQDGVNAFIASKCNSRQIATQIERIINAEKYNLHWLEKNHCSLDCTRSKESCETVV